MATSASTGPRTGPTPSRTTVRCTRHGDLAMVHLRVGSRPGRPVLGDLFGWEADVTSSTATSAGTRSRPLPPCACSTTPRCRRWCPTTRWTTWPPRCTQEDAGGRGDDGRGRHGWRGWARGDDDQGIPCWSTRPGGHEDGPPDSAGHGPGRAGVHPGRRHRGAERSTGPKLRLALPLATTPGSQYFDTVPLVGVFDEATAFGHEVTPSATLTYRSRPWRPCCAGSARPWAARRGGRRTDIGPYSAPSAQTTRAPDSASSPPAEWRARAWPGRRRRSRLRRPRPRRRGLLRSGALPRSVGNDDGRARRHGPHGSPGHWSCWRVSSSRCGGGTVYGRGSRSPYRSRTALARRPPSWPCATCGGAAVGLTGGFWTGLLVTGPAVRLAMRLLAVTGGDDAQGRITEAEEVVGSVSLDGTIPAWRAVRGRAARPDQLGDLRRRPAPAPCRVARRRRLRPCTWWWRRRASTRCSLTTGTSTSSAPAGWR